MKYLGTAHKTGNISMNYLADAIKKITVKYLYIQEKSVELYDCLPKSDECVVGFWIGANEVVWYLDIVYKITKD